MPAQYILRQRAYARRRLLQDADKLGSIAAACRLHHVSRACFYKWKARYDGTLESLLDRSRRPRSHPRQLTPAEQALVERVARQHRTRGLYHLHHLLVTYHHFHRSVGAVYKALKRAGFYAPAKRKRRRKYKRYEQPWPGANVQIDVKYVPQIRCQQEYQYTAIDEYSRLRYAAIYSENTPRQAVRFLRDALDFFQQQHIRVEQVQTDHGAEFTWAMFPHICQEHPFERELRQAGIRRKLTPIGKPHLQGKVERSHRIDDEEFHDRRYYRTSAARKRAFRSWIAYYNHRRAHGSLNWRSPAQHLQAWHQAQSVNHV
jgi:transposase InsO family protein